MNLRLQRRLYRSDGIFSDLKDDAGNFLMVALDHAYDDGSGKFIPKLNPGIYTCQRSPHRLDGMTSDFITFAVMNVPGHSNILIHWGNYNKDSDGCVLVGKSVAFLNGIKMITRSRESFDSFMQLEDGCDTFQLTVIG